MTILWKSIWITISLLNCVNVGKYKKMSWGQMNVNFTIAKTFIFPTMSTNEVCVMEQAGFLLSISLFWTLCSGRIQVLDGQNMQCTEPLTQICLEKCLWDSFWKSVRRCFHIGKLCLGEWRWWRVTSKKKSFKVFLIPSTIKWWHTEAITNHNLLCLQWTMCEQYGG